MAQLRLLISATLMAAYTACTSGPVPERAPQDLRLSIRQLNRGTHYYKKGCFSKAAQHFRNAHERFAASDNLRGTADSLNSLANAYYRLNDMDRAVLVYDEAEALYDLLSDKMGRVRALTNKSVALASWDKLQDAQEALNLADTLARPDDMLRGLRLKARAILKLKTNEPEESKQLLEEAIKVIPQSDINQYASAQYAMGYVLLSTRQPRKAIKYIKRALAADRTAGDHFGIGQDLEALGDCRVQLNQHAQATTEFKRSIKIYALLNDTQKVQTLSSKLLKSASESGTDIQITLDWAAQWLAGLHEADICR
jgi:tetratricopeptide (TPR) repeat protein